MTTEIKQKKSASEPWSDLDELFDTMRQRFFESFDVQPWGLAMSQNPSAPMFRAARTDVADTGKAYKIVAEIPGIPKENLDIRVRGSTVEIRGEATKESPRSDEPYVHRERAYAGYYRTLELAEPVVASDAKAKVENGLLTLELPKQHPSESEVKVAVQ